MINLKFKNYVQKGAIALVAIMLLTIPNMHVYSFIGSYQGLSQATIVNDYYDIQHNDNERFFVPVMGVPVIGVGAAALLVVGAIITYATSLGVGVPALLVLGGDVCPQGDTILSKIVLRNYSKYDFSEFDN